MTTRDKVAQAVTIVLGDAVKMVVKKATTRIEAPPKRKHVQTLSYYIRNQRANIAYLVDCLSCRFRKTNWVVALKSLLTTHLLIINSDNDNFLSHLSTRTGLFDLSWYVDRSSLYAVDMSVYVGTYAKFLGAKCDTFKCVGYDVSKKSADQYEFDPEKLEHTFEEVELIYKMVIAIFDNNVNFHNRSSVLQTVHMFLTKELLRVYTSYNRRVIFLLENINDLEARDAVKLLEQYKSLCSLHQPIQSIIDDASSHFIEGLQGMKLARPSESLVESIENFVHDIVKSRGSKILKAKWTTSTRKRTPTCEEEPTRRLQRILSYDFDPTSAMDKLELTYDPPNNNSTEDIIDLNFESHSGTDVVFDSWTGKSSRNTQEIGLLSDQISQKQPHGLDSNNILDAFPPDQSAVFHINQVTSSITGSSGENYNQFFTTRAQQGMFTPNFGHEKVSTAGVMTSQSARLAGDSVTPNIAYKPHAQGSIPEANSHLEDLFSSVAIPSRQNNPPPTAWDQHVSSPTLTGTSTFEPQQYPGVQKTPMGDGLKRHNINQNNPFI